ncbi:unnamed protein product [Paramecium octaurelia]|uniref:Uncharacterized protein n=1 Tax=Paramecium octaurelia TaxID=43137 RepID=A0A8S1UCJ2_PAROT|nr:unnamed protein product [Paramecium octaurelia]
MIWKCCIISYSRLNVLQHSTKKRILTTFSCFHKIGHIMRALLKVQRSQQIQKRRRRVRVAQQKNLKARAIFQILQGQKEKQLEAQLMQEERISDQISAQSRELVRKLRVDSQVSTSEWRSQAYTGREEQEVNEIVKTLDLAQIIDGKKNETLLPPIAFPQEVTRFVEAYWLNSYLRLFMKHNYEYAKSPLMKDYFQNIISRGLWN